MRTVQALLKTLRPHQWTKNVLVLAALVFDVKLFALHYVLRAFGGVMLFSLASGAVYILNDLADLEKDRHHPSKRHRPLPAGELSPSLAAITASGLVVATLAAGFYLNRSFAFILLGYLLLQVLYSLRLKHVVLLDVMAIAAGFVLRVAAGVPLVDATISPWLYICTTFLALFLALSKRRGELVALREEATNHRPILEHYNLTLLDQLIGMVTSSTVLAYALYTFSAPNLPKNYTMMLTIPYVIYGLFRYVYLIHREGCTLPPDEVLLKDHPSLINILLWGLTVISIMYLGRAPT